MPKGISRTGVRRKRRTKAEMALVRGNSIKFKPSKVEALRPYLIASNNLETDKQIEERISERFDILELLTNATIKGDSKAMVVSGPAGLGKSYTIEDCLKNVDPNKINHKIIKGYVKATGLYKMLWQHRAQGQVIVFDDADSIFDDDVALNMLKAVCDTNETRTVSYLADYKMVDEDTAEIIPNSFVFEGSVIFITNIDFQYLIDKGHKRAPHLSALLSRSHYVDLALKTKRDYIVRIKQVIDNGLFDKYDITANQKREVVDYIEKNAENLRELSLRSAMKIAVLRKTSETKWKNLANVTCCRN